MALHILQPSQVPTASGEAVNAIGNILSGLAEGKLNQLKQRQFAAGLESLPGGAFTPEQAQGLAALSSSNPKVAQEIIKGMLQQQREREYAQGYAGRQGQIAEGGALAGVVPRNPREEFELRKEQAAQEEKAYGHILEENKPFYEKFNKQIEEANEMEPILTDFIDLLEHGGESKGLKGKVASGVLGAITPKVLQSEAAQYADNLLNKIVALEASGYGGAALTKAKQDLAASTKISAHLQPKVQLRIARDLQKIIKEIKAKEDIEDQIRRENNGRQIRGMRKEIERRYKTQEKEKSSVGKDIFPRLQAPDSVKPFKEFNIPQANIKVRSNGKEWEIV